MNALSGTCVPLRRMHINLFQRVGILLECRIHFEHDVILVQLRKNRGDLPLAERVVQRVVDRLRQNSQPRCRVAINRQGCLHAALLLIAGHIAQLGKSLNLSISFGAHSASSLPSASSIVY